MFAREAEPSQEGAQVARLRSVPTVLLVGGLAAALVLGGFVESGVAGGKKPTEAELRDARQAADLLDLQPTKSLLRTFVESGRDLCKQIKRAERRAETVDFATGLMDVADSDVEAVVEASVALVTAFCKNYREVLKEAIDLARLDSGSAGAAPTPTTVAATALLAERCVGLRTEWENFIVTDFDEARRIQRQYRSIGCYEECGDLVEDTDTPQREQFC